jgi:hypothetical protein
LGGISYSFNSGISGQQGISTLDAYWTTWVAFKIYQSQVQFPEISNLIGVEVNTDVFNSVEARVGLLNK